MKQKSLRAGIVGGMVIAVVFGVSVVHFSSAQTANSSSSATSTASLEAATSSSLDQLSSSTTSSSDLTVSSSSPQSTSTSSDVTSSSTTSGSTASTTPTSTTTQSATSMNASATVATSTPSSSDSLASSSSSSSTPLLLSPISTTASSGISTPPPPPAPVPTGYPTCDQTIKNVPGDYPTIQAAIDAANIGDTIKIAAGTYNEDVNLKSGICFEGAGIDQTIISKGGASGITGDSVSYVIMKGFTVQDSGCAPGVCGGGSNGGGIQLAQSSNIIVQSCRLAGNAAVDGGGMSVSQSSIAMDHCLIDGNTASNVGGAIVKDAASTVTITNITVANNHWANPLGNGGVGGISADGSGLQITNSIVWGNTGQNFFGNGSQVSNSDIGGWSGGTNNVTSNPGFVSATDYHLQASSTVDMGAY